MFARDHTVFGRQRLPNVLWTDESKFNLDFNDRRRRVWRQRNERFRDYCVVEHDRFGGGSVLVWAVYPTTGTRTSTSLGMGPLTV